MSLIRFGLGAFIRAAARNCWRRPASPPRSLHSRNNTGRCCASPCQGFPAVFEQATWRRGLWAAGAKGSTCWGSKTIQMPVWRWAAAGKCRHRRCRSAAQAVVEGVFEPSMQPTVAVVQQRQIAGHEVNGPRFAARPMASDEVPSMPEAPRKLKQRWRPMAGPPQVSQSRTGELAASITGSRSGNSWGSQ